MHILQFRPYKKWDKDQLLAEIDRVSQYVNQLGKEDLKQREYLNQLFLEARTRKVTLSPEDTYNRILYYIDQ